MRTIDRRVWSNAQSHLICPKLEGSAPAGRHRRGWFRRLLFEVRSLRRCENQACTCGGQIRIRIAFARQRDHGFRECLAYFVGVVLVCYESRCSCGNIRQCTELVCADGRQHGDDRPFRTRACQFFGRIPAHEAETVRQQQHTYDHSTRSGPQRGFYDFPIDSHWAFLRFEGRSIVRARTERSLSKIAHSSRPHSFKGVQLPQSGGGSVTFPPVTRRSATYWWPPATTICRQSGGRVLP